MVFPNSRPTLEFGFQSYQPHTEYWNPNARTDCSMLWQRVILQYYALYWNHTGFLKIEMVPEKLRWSLKDSFIRSVWSLKLPALILRDWPS